MNSGAMNIEYTKSLKETKDNLQRHIKIASWLFEFESLPLPSNDQQGDSQAIEFENLNYVLADKIS
jgi:hypothetical protein